MSIAARLAGITVVGVLLASLSTGYVMVQAASRVTERSSETTRSYGLERLCDLVENYSEIGLDLDRMTALQGVIERSKERDPSILSIDVFGRDGRIAYSTDPAGIGLSVPVSWQSAATSAQAPADNQSHLQPFTLLERGEVIVGSGVLDTIGRPLATVVISAVREEAIRDQDLGFKIAIGSVIAALAGSALAIGGALLVARKLRHEIARASVVLAGAASGAAIEGRLAVAAAAADATWTKAAVDFDSASRELERIDESI